MKHLKTALLVSSIAMASSAFAATQGSLGTGGGSGGASSTGNLDITLTVNSFIQVNRLDNIALGTYAGSGDSQGSEQFCVRSNASTFSIRFDDYNNGTASQFELAEDGAGVTTIPYDLEMATVDTSGVVGTYNSVSYNTDITGVSERRVLANCDVSGTNRDNISIRVTVPEVGGLADAVASTYTGYLGVTVAPE